MMSYKQWQLLKESLFPLGLSQAQNVSPIVGQFQYLDEKKKHMDGENPEDDYDDEEVADDDDDSDDDEAPRKKKGCGDDDDGDDVPAFMKKKGMKKKMKNECDCDGKKGKSIEADDDDDDDDGSDDDGDGELAGDDGDMGDDDGADMKRPLGFMKKKGMKKKMKSEAREESDDSVAKGLTKKWLKKKMKKESANPSNDFLQSFNSYVAPQNQMTSEDAWWKSVQSHFSNPNQKFSDGFSEYMEDYLIDPQAQQNFVQGNGQQTGPRPGEVGFAPQQRMGWFGTAHNEGGTSDPFAG